MWDPGLSYITNDEEGESVDTVLSLWGLTHNARMGSIESQPPTYRCVYIMKSVLQYRHSSSMAAMLMSASWAAAAAPWSRWRRSKNALTLHVYDFNAMPEYAAPERDWAELPLDALWDIFRRLDQIELLIGGAAGVCRSWRRAARGEPELWRRIDMRDQFVPSFDAKVSLKIMAGAALRHGAGRCEAFYADDATDEVLLSLAEQAPSLKSLRLITSYDISNEAFAAAIKKFPLLEELEISRCIGIKKETSVLELVAGACPRLKHLKYVKRSSYLDPAAQTTNSEAMAVVRMRHLRTLEISPSMAITDAAALAAIVDSCHHLQYLDTSNCACVDDAMDKGLRAKLERIGAGGECGDLPFQEDGEPVVLRNFAVVWEEMPVGINYGYGCPYGCCREPPDDCWEPDYDSLGDDGVDDDHVEKAERAHDLKSMRRYLVW